MYKANKNIAVFTTSYLPVLGGLQFQLYWMMKWIDDNYNSLRDKYGFNKICFIVPRCQDNPYINFINVKIIEYEQSGGKLGFLFTSTRLLSIFNREKISLIHCSHALADGLYCFMARLFLGIKYIVTAHGDDLAYNREFNYGARLKKTNDLLIRLVLSRASMLTTVSNEMLGFAKEVCRENKIVVIPDAKEYGAEIYSETELDKEVSSLRVHYKLKDSSMICLTLSGARKIKGHDNMLRAFKIAREKNRQLSLFITAHGPDMDRVKALVKELGLENNVFFVGFVEGIRKKALLAMSDVYINTTFVESFGIVYLEAMDNNIAILGSRRGAGRDILEHKKNAYLIDPYSVSEIAMGLEYLSSKENRERIVTSASRLREKFTADKVFPGFFEVYKRFI